MNLTNHKDLTKYLKNNPGILLAILFGSHAKKNHTKNSDYDFAILMNTRDKLENLALKESIRKEISLILKTKEEKIDIVDISTAGLSISSTIVAEGRVLKGDGSLELSQFFLKTWALEEDFYWRLNNENRALSS